MTEGSVVWTVPEVPGELGESGALAALGAALAHGGEPELRVDIIFVDDAELARLHGAAAPRTLPHAAWRRLGRGDGEHGAELL